MIIVMVMRDLLGYGHMLRFVLYSKVIRVLFYSIGDFLAFYVL